MIFKKILHILIVSLFIFFSCSKEKSTKKRDGLTIYQEAQLSWVRNFNPLSPAGSARWPTSAGIYEPLFIYNSMTAEYVPWLATRYTWGENNTVLTIAIRQGVSWSDGESFTAKDVAFTFNLKKQHRALDTRDSWGYLEEVVSTTDSTVPVSYTHLTLPTKRIV